MAKDFTKLANDVVEAVGGVENIHSVSHCTTRLRFVLNDVSKADEATVKAVDGVLGVVNAGGQYQVVIGNRVTIAYDEICKIPGINAGGSVDIVEKEDLKAKGVLNTIMKTISGCITPGILAMCGSGMLRGILALLTQFGILSADSGTYMVLYAASDAVFRYLPFLIAFSAAKVFNCNPFMAVTIVGAMCYPTIAGMEAGTTFLGIPLTVVDYHQSVLPPILCIFAYAKLEQFLKKVIPDAAYQFVMPCIGLAIMVPLSLLVIGPVFNALGVALSSGYSAIYKISPLIPGIVLGGFWQILVVFGVHMTFVPIMMQNLATLGFDTMIPIIGPSNFSMAGAVLGVFLKSKKNNVRSVAGSAALSGVLGGITEPAIYGICLPYRKPLYAAIVGGICGGVVTALAGTQATAVVIPGLFTLPAFMGSKGFLGMVLGMVISLVVSAVLAYILYNDDLAE